VAPTGRLKKMKIMMEAKVVLAPSLVFSVFKMAILYQRIQYLSVGTQVFKHVIEQGMAATI
jgi:hypothetical protein